MQLIGSHLINLIGLKIDHRSVKSILLRIVQGQGFTCRIGIRYCLIWVLRNACSLSIVVSIGYFTNVGTLFHITDHVCTAKEQIRARTEAAIFTSQQSKLILNNLDTKFLFLFWNHMHCKSFLGCSNFVSLFFGYLKLGDPQNKGASNADFYLSNLLSDHPNMKVQVLVPCSL